MINESTPVVMTHNSWDTFSYTTMTRIFRTLIGGVFLMLVMLACSTAKEKPPNVLLILADDLGFSDLGCYGGEIETPNLDKLATGGLRFSQFNNCARCWPTRAALLTGYYPQQVGRDNAPGISGGGGSGAARPNWAILLPVYLKEAGYRSYHSGKWHMDGMPIECGFDRSYYLADQGRFFSPKTHYEDDRKLPRVERGTGYYSTIKIADKAIEHLKEHQVDHAGQPFFTYLAFTAPHFPLHALPEDIRVVGDRYQAGWDQLREKRWERIKEIGMITGKLSQVEPDLGPPYHFPDALVILGDGEVNRPVSWDSLTTEQKEFQMNKMTIHAAMIERMDKEIGRVITQLDVMIALDNTLIVFLSDNGASAEIMVRDDGHNPNAGPGSADTYLCLGPGWSTLSNTPFRKHKTWVHEGGSCTPLIVHWSHGIKARGELRHTHGHVTDIVPTILDLAGVPEEVLGTVPFPGRTLTPVFVEDTNQVNPSWYFHEGNRAIRIGNWKLVAARDEAWELFNLNEDRTETQDLSYRMPERMLELEEYWEKMLNDIREVAPQKSDTKKKIEVTTKNLE